MERTKLKAEKNHTEVTKTWRRLTPAPRLNLDFEPQHPITLAALIKIANGDGLPKNYNLDEDDDGVLIPALFWPDDPELRAFSNALNETYPDDNDDSLFDFIYEIISFIARWNAGKIPADEKKFIEGVSAITIEDGRIHAFVDPIIRWLDGVDISRVRKCDTCYRFFWAGRITAKCCSRKCNHTRIMRESRSEEQKAQRSGNRRYKQNRHTKNSSGSGFTGRVKS
jgi:hypothetical protein